MATNYGNSIGNSATGVVGVSPVELTRTPLISQQLTDLMGALEEQAKIIDMLHQRIELTLSPVPPGQSQPAVPEPSLGVELADRLRALVQQVRKHNEHLMTLRDRCEL